jgi:ABC-2 type transport system permease protein
MAKNKQTRAATESVGFLIVVGAILVVANVVAGSFALGRFDLTKNDTYSLSEGSRQLARGLEDEMVVTAYFSGNLPPPFNSTERYVRDLLAEYEAASNGNIRVRFVDPDQDEERESAEQDGVRLVGQRVYANDSVSVVEGYRGIAMTYLGETKAIPVIATTNGLEYSITMLMKQMTGEMVKVGVVSGHEGPTLDGELAVLRRVMPTYELAAVDLSQDVPDGMETLLVIAPETPFAEAELRKLDAFVMGGGSLGVFGGGIKLEDAQTLGASPIDSGLNRLLERWGVRMSSDVLGDARCQVIGVRGPLGVAPRPYPPLAIVQFTEEQAEHPATYRLTEARMPFASTLSLTEDAPEGVRRTVLATSSEQSWSMTGDAINLDQTQRWSMNGPIGPFPLIVALEGKLPSAFAAAASSEGGEATPAESPEDARVLVIGSGAAPIIQLPEGQQVADEELASALALPLNSIDWLANDDDLVAIRAKNVDEPSLDIPQAVLEAQDEETQAIENRDVEGVLAARERAGDALKAWDAKKDGYRWANLLGIPVGFAIFGVIRLRRRARKKASTGS